MTGAGDAIEVELERAHVRIAELAGSILPAITVASLGPEDAPFLGANISKLSPFVGNLLERMIVDELTTVPGEAGYIWRRQDPGFPDAGIYDPDGHFTGHGIEVKAWYGLATEITGRFRPSQLYLEGKRIDVALVSWAMSQVVAGQPLILGTCMVDAMSLAKARDAHYHNPPHYLVEQPTDTSGRGAQLQQMNVGGYVLQGGDPGALQEAETLVEAFGTTPIPHDRMTAQLVKDLRGKLPYRLDTNFAKIDRVGEPTVEGFKAATLVTWHAGHTIAQWRAHLARLANGTPGPALDASVAAVQSLY